MTGQPGSSSCLEVVGVDAVKRVGYALFASDKYVLFQRESAGGCLRLSFVLVALALLSIGCVKQFHTPSA